MNELETEQMRDRERERIWVEVLAGPREITLCQNFYSAGTELKLKSSGARSQTDCSVS